MKRGLALLLCVFLLVSCGGHSSEAEVPQKPESTDEFDSQEEVTAEEETPSDEELESNDGKMKKLLLPHLLRAETNIGRRSHYGGRTVISLCRSYSLYFQVVIGKRN